LVLGGNFLGLIERAGRRGHAGYERRLAYSAPVRRLEAKIMEKGDPWLQDEVSR
jgi:hypothetical protein